MIGFEGALQDLIEQLGTLPGIGPKSAQRLAFHILSVDSAQAEALADAIKAVKQKVNSCEVCGNVTEEKICSICADPRRDETVLCVVEEARDIAAVEKTRVFRGKYHVLGGVIDPLQGIGSDQLRMRELFTRLSDGTVKEVILATNPTVEGEATSSYIARLVLPMEIQVTRLASGLPVGGDVENADEVTLGRALEGRMNI